MSTPITPSLSQMLFGRPAATPTQAAPADTASSFTQALDAQKSFFRQASGAAPQVNPAERPAIKPAGTIPPTFKAAEIAQAQHNPDEVKLLRPGSLLNIRV